MIVWANIEPDLRRVMEHPGFVEISHHSDLGQPWAVGLNLSTAGGITWFHAHSLSAALTLAIVGIERIFPGVKP